MKNIHREIVKLFLKLGVFAYGGPAAHIAMMNDEVVVKRKWLTEDEFLDLISFTNIIPGPNSTETAILIGYKKAGIAGLLLAGISFIIPAVVIVLLFTILYVKYQTVPSLQNALMGMTPIMLAIIASAFIRMSKSNVKTVKSLIILVVASILLLLKVSELVVLLVSGLLALLNSEIVEKKLFSVEPFSLTVLFLTFLKIGSLLYGSGYVLISFLQSEFVNRLGWLSQTQLYDLVLIGEITPGPVFTTATAIGYYLSGFWGALFSTVAIFIPSFLLIMLLYPLYERLKKIEMINKFLSGVSVASLAIMLNVVISLSLSIKHNIFLVILALFSLFLLRKYKVNSIYLIILGGFVGFVLL